jgi:hypothetical protein
METTIKYDDATHTYELDGKPVPSVSELATRFSNLDTEYFRAHPEYAERGTDAHTELARYYDPNDPFEAKDFTQPLATDIAIHLKRSPNMKTEVIVYNTAADEAYAGTADLIYLKDKTVTGIVDFKTGQHINKKYCTCQLNLYRLALEEMGYDCSKAKMLIVNPTGIFEMERKGYDEIVAMENKELALDTLTSTMLDSLEMRMKELSPFVDEYEDCKWKMSQVLQESMSAQGAHNWVGNKYKATFVESTSRTSIDSKKLVELYPIAYNECLKTTNVKAFVKIGTLETKE